MCRLSLVVSGGCSLVAGQRLLIALASLVAEPRFLGAQASVVMACGLSSCSSQAPEHRLNSCGTCCSKACRIFLDQGSNLCLLHWQVDCLPWSHQGSPLLWIIFIKNYVQDFFILDYKYLNEMEGSEKNSSLYPLPASSTQ